jgi:hypothetical protein
MDLTGQRPCKETAQDMRIAALSRAFRRHLLRGNGKPSTLEAHALRRAAVLTARAEAAAADPSVSVDEIVRIDNAAARARAAFAKVIRDRWGSAPPTYRAKGRAT